MKSILLVDTDSKIPNIALMKISTFHKNKGDDVTLLKLNIPYAIFKKPKTRIVNCKKYNTIYISIVFDTTLKYLMLRNEKDKKVFFGGSGYDFKIKLDDEINKCELDYTIYPENKTSYGFITRGCIRNCYFCIVLKKEGKLYLESSIDDIIRHKEVKFLDNNFLAYKKHKEILKELRDRKIRFQFNQGLDIRLIDEENIKLLSECNYMNELTFAFDDIKSKKMIENKLEILKKYYPKKWSYRFFVYVNADMELKETLDRVKFLRENDCLIYLMRDKNCWKSKYSKFYIDLATWCNLLYLYKKMNFEMFLKHEYKQYRIEEHLKLYNEEIK